MRFQAVRIDTPSEWARRASNWARRPHTLALVPAVSLLAYFWGGELWLVASVVALQSVWLIVATRDDRRPSEPRRAPCRPVPRETVEATLNEGSGGALTSAALLLRLDDFDTLTAHHGELFIGALAEALTLRLGQGLRTQDAYCVLSDAKFAIALAPLRGTAVETVLAVAQRLQADLAKPFRYSGVTVWPSVSVGICLNPATARAAGLGMIEAAERAARIALNSGPGGVHSFSATDTAAPSAPALRAELRRALDNGEICAFFQPQVELASGAVSGMETLARWLHPERGLIPPAEFLPLIEAEGLSTRLAERMLRDGLATLNRLDAQGLVVPNVAVNLSAPELGNPQLADTIAWELDRHDLAPERLVLEIVETVVTHTDDDVLVKNVARLAALGCGIDLDDFGTGHASIANIRRFAVSRVKIDRSFVTHMHRDPDQRRMVAAILSMTGELGLQCVAEGIEAPEEASLLAKMGCEHGQGFGIARPMPATDLARWLRTQAAIRAGTGAAAIAEGERG
ncbi:bifunctional diguanylate cyclase/phosphodiesterase [Pararhodobacter sp. SW119]|uniref:putative bifunctional diguanylate cyclase/phosphodiesterase n=1 Tax=Pararhodobacter sp. SW119 TaxID=2780075 RepID=UPI001AE07260|nr:bifunctional diguanylate cyclase/phosphodiesterase [Pararhodobacter sp. SW119]